MLWRVIVTLWWIGVALSFFVAGGLSLWAMLTPGVPASERLGTAVGIWIRWVLGLIGGVVSLLILGFILFILGFDVAGFSATRR